MRMVIQRVSSASVVINGSEKRSIRHGLVLLAGIEGADTQDDIDWMVSKVVQMRIFSDDEGKMNRSITDVDGQIMLISQFTLFASTKKGNRPSFIQAAKPDVAIPLYESSIRTFEKALGASIVSGEFGADMQVALVNDGPVTIIMDSKNRQ